MKKVIQSEFESANVLITSQAHLSADEAVNLGSYYTPIKYVNLALDWLREIPKFESYTVIDPSCGYGSFLALSNKIKNRIIGNDIDSAALEVARKKFASVEFLCENKFTATRETFRLGEDEKLIVVGNPPYNDITSQINASVKREANVEMDCDLRTRDLGMSSLRLYTRLKADYVLILHPLSYLIKEANFKICRAFFSQYRLIENIVFSSREFEGTSRVNEFPIIMGLYARQKSSTITYRDICHQRFNLVDGGTFALSDFDFVTDFVQKYPVKNAEVTNTIFYTLRDINALKRSRTFVTTYGSNCLYVKADQLPYYCYIDCFKHYCKNHSLPFWMGNLNIPFSRERFDSISDDVCNLAFARHPDVFDVAKISFNPLAAERVDNYISLAIKGGNR